MPTLNQKNPWVNHSIKMKKLHPLFDYEEEIYSEPRDPFLTVGKVFIGLIIAVFIILSLHVVLWRVEAKMNEVEQAIKN